MTRRFHIFALLVMMLAVLTLSLAGGAQAQVFRDTFTGTTGTALESHAPDIGTSWTKLNTATGLVLSGSGTLIGQGSTGSVIYRANGTGLGTDYYVQIDTGNTAANSQYRLWSQMSGTDPTAAGGSGYEILYNGSQFYVFAWKNGVQAFAGQSGALTLTGPQTFRVRTTVNTSSVDFVIGYGPVGGSQTTFTVSDTATDRLTTGLPGLEGFNSAAANSADNFVAGAGGSPSLLAGTLSSSVSASAITLSTTAAAGGVGPYSYQLKRSATPGGTYASVGTASSSATMTDTPSDLSVYYYQVAATDSAGTPATTSTNHVGAARLDAALAIGFIGDSNFFGVPSDGTETLPQIWARLLGKLPTPKARTVTVSNQAFSGYNSASFVPGATPGGPVTYTTAKNAFLAAGVTDIVYMIGTNDAGSTSKATYKSNVQATIKALQTDIPGSRVFLCYPLPLLELGTNNFTAGNTSLLDYQAALDELAAANTGVYVIGKSLYRYMLNRPGEMNADGKHLLKAGAESMAALQVRDYLAIAAPGGGTAIIRRRIN